VYELLVTVSSTCGPLRIGISDYAECPFCRVYSVVEYSSTRSYAGMSLRGTLALNLKELREARNLSQEELADLAEIDRTYVSYLENQKYSATLDMIEKLAAALDIPPLKLLSPIRSNGLSEVLPRRSFRRVYAVVEYSSGRPILEDEYSRSFRPKPEEVPAPQRYLSRGVGAFGRH
jgi:transcriptional regulator with XRE-family HTH domain